MKGLMKVALGEGNVEIRDLAEPSAGPGQVVLEVAAAGICGTDIHIYHDEYRSCPPMVLGHEVAGKIVEVGEGVARVKVGDRVTSETFFYTCGQCQFCRSGLPNLCPQRQSIGTHVNGAFTRYLVVPARLVHVLPNEVDLVSGALTEPVACVVHGVLERTGILAGDTVLVSGPGAIGLITMQVARSAGARVIICGISSDESRLDMARSLGAEFVVDVQQDKLTDIVYEVTDGVGVDVAVECAGAPASLDQCLTLVRKGGSVSQMGLYARPIEADMNLIPMKELRFFGSFSHVPTAWPRALRLMAEGKVQTGALVTMQTSITEWKGAFEAFNTRSECRIVLTPVD